MLAGLIVGMVLTIPLWLRLGGAQSSGRHRWAPAGIRKRPIPPSASRIPKVDAK